MIWLQIFNKTHKCSSALSCTFVNTSIFQHVNKHISNFFMKNLFNIVFIKMIVLRKEFFYPLRMFSIFSLEATSLPSRIYSSKSSSSSLVAQENCQAHNLDQTDILLLNMMVLCMRMIYAKRIFFCGNIVS